MNKGFFIMMIACLFLMGNTKTRETMRPGKDFALFFAVDSYDDAGWTDLKNPIKDAKVIEKELKEMYGFQTEFYPNPSKRKIQDVLTQWQKKSFASDAQLFVFISGHGAFSESQTKGFFVPKNGKYRDAYNESHLDLTTIGNMVTRIPCKHILLSIDACYSGTIDEKIAFKGMPAFDRPMPSIDYDPRTPVIEQQLRNQSRWLLTSGGKERTPDGRGHSPFSNAIIKGLRNAYTIGDGLLTIKDLLASMERVSPMPHQGELPEHAGGGFVFVSKQLPARPKPKAQPTKRESPPPQTNDLPNMPKMIFIPGETFKMGSNEGDDDEKPVHPVTVRDFYLAETEVTNVQFCAFLNAKGNQEEGGQKWYNDEGPGYKGYAKPFIQKNGNGKWTVQSGKENYPVNYVSWYGAKAYCAWASIVTGENWRLPSEAEWEYAAGNGATHSKYSWGNQLPSGKKGGNVADKSAKATFSDWTIFDNYDDGYTGIAPVRKFDANRYQLFDMSGNLWEWCQDKWHSSYENAPDIGTAWESGESSRRVIRGGSWLSYPASLRVAYRYNRDPSSRYYDVGFRPARTP